MCKPVFLVAARRSGTTLFRLMLNGHPDVIWTRGWETVAEAAERLGDNGTTEQTFHVEGCGPVSARTLTEFRSRLEARLAEVLAAEGATLFGSNVHVNIKALLKIWPEARFIHLVRDPRDIAMSFLKLKWANQPLGAAGAWRKAETDWQQMLGALAEDQYLELRYEDLVADAEAELKRVCDFLGIAFDPGLFAYVDGSNYGAPKPELAYRWRGKLRDSAVRQIEYGLHDLMRARGYDPAFAPAEFSAAFKIWSKTLGLWQRRFGDLRRYGLSYLLARKLGRACGIGFLTAYAARAEAARKQKHVEALEARY